jgi:hypothetical protein
MSQILTQNGKMKKSSQNGIDVFNFGIPAFKSETGLKTCPMAGVCATGCYARSGTYNFGNVKNAYEERLKLTQNENFVDVMVAEINLKLIKSKIKGNQCLIRIHDSGDFYSKDYAMSWIEIVEKCPEVRFYAYTKMVSLFETLADENFRPKNLKIIYSFGGLQDSLIDTNRHYHAKVFQSEAQLASEGYVDATQDDMVTALGVSKRIGLVYHGQKSYSNTSWIKSIK